MKLDNIFSKSFIKKNSLKTGQKLDPDKKYKDMCQMTNKEKELSFGGKAVGLNFNPGGNEDVNKVKNLYAEIIDGLNDLRNGDVSVEVKRLCAIAITEAQGAQMWAVKAITWKEVK